MAKSFLSATGPAFIVAPYDPKSDRADVKEVNGATLIQMIKDDKLSLDDGRVICNTDAESKETVERFTVVGRLHRRLNIMFDGLSTEHLEKIRMSMKLGDILKNTEW